MEEKIIHANEHDFLGYLRRALKKLNYSCKIIYLNIESFLSETQLKG